MSTTDRTPPAADQPAGTAGDTREHDAPVSGISRRQAVAALATLPLVGSIRFSGPTLERAMRVAEAASAEREAGGAPYKPKFFTAHEWRTVRMLVDYVIPRDAKSGSATDAGVPEFMDFIMGDKPNNQIWMRGGLGWLDLECERRHGTTFVASKLSQRTALLDDIAWPDKAPPELRAGVAFFNRFRDMTASGFFTTKMGIDDLQYMGNRMMPGWNGCPDAALAKLGVKYSDVYKNDGKS